MTDSRLSTETERPNARADAKLRALVYYFIEQCTGTQAQLGAIRLNKALWFTDVYYYLSTGRQMTESVYVKRSYPVPKRIVGKLYDLQEQGTITIIRPGVPFDAHYFGINKPTDEFNGVLSKSEKAFAKTILDAVLGHSINEINQVNHDVFWQETPEGEVLDIEKIALRMHPPPFTPEEINEMCDRLVNSGLGFVLVED